MKIFDTQVISFSFKGNNQYDIVDGYITSTVASEFLLQYDKNFTNKAKYYIPLSNGNHLPLSELRKRVKESDFKRYTDNLVIDLGQELGRFIEFSSKAMSFMINSGNIELLKVAINHLDKKEQKLILEKFRFLVAQNIKCIPMSDDIISMSLNWLVEYSKNHNIKSNVRNSMNDIIIFATAFDKKSLLISEDKELNRFMADTLSLNISRESDFIQIDMANLSDKVRKLNRESKGYVNKGWFYKMIKAN